MKRELTHGSLFSGVEGFGLGAALAGIKTEWSCEFEKYSKAVSEMYSQFKKAHPMEKYIGQLARCRGGKVLEVVGYTEYWDGSYGLITDATLFNGWRDLGVGDVVFKECKSYWYASINDLID